MRITVFYKKGDFYFSKQLYTNYFWLRASNRKSLARLPTNTISILEMTQDEAKDLVQTSSTESNSSSIDLFPTSSTESTSLSDSFENQAHKKHQTANENTSWN